MASGTKLFSSLSKFVCKMILEWPIIIVIAPNRSRRSFELWSNIMAKSWIRKKWRKKNTPKQTELPSFEGYSLWVIIRYVRKINYKEINITIRTPVLCPARFWQFPLGLFPCSWQHVCFWCWIPFMWLRRLFSWKARGSSDPPRLDFI